MGVYCKRELHAGRGPWATHRMSQPNEIGDRSNIIADWVGVYVSKFITNLRMNAHLKVAVENTLHSFTLRYLYIKWLCQSDRVLKVIGTLGPQQVYQTKNFRFRHFLIITVLRMRPRFCQKHLRGS